MTNKKIDSLVDTTYSVIVESKTVTPDAVSETVFVNEKQHPKKVDRIDTHVIRIGLTVRLGITTHYS